MGYKYITRSDINEEKWNALVANHSLSLPYFHTSYLDAVCDWDAIVNSDYTLICPIPKKKKFLFHYIYTPPFVQQLGILSEEDFNYQEVLETLPKKYKLTELAFNESNADFETAQINRNTLLSLNSNYASIYKNYSNNHKRNIKKVADQYKIEEIEILELWQLFKKDRGEKLNKFNETTLDILNRIVKCGLECFAWGVKSDGHWDTGILVVKYNKRLVFLFSGNSSNGKRNRGMYFLLDQLIQKYAGQDMILDFEGSNEGNLARFYKGFGGEHVTYPFLRSYQFPLNWVKS